MTDRQRLEDRRDIALRDLTELEEQVEAGEIDPDTAESLRVNYQAELAEVTAQLEAQPPPNRRRLPSARRVVLRAVSARQHRSRRDSAQKAAGPWTGQQAPHLRVYVLGWRAGV